MKKLIIISLILSLVGCKALVKSADDFTNLVAINNEVSSGNVSAIINSVELNNVDQQVLTHSINYFNAFAYKWKNIKELDATTEEFTRFQYEYLELKTQYFLVNNIVIKNWHLYTPQNQDLLKQYRNQAEQANNTFDNLKAKGTRIQMIYAGAMVAKVLIGILK
ncbi:MAG: hypothetical protein A3F67_08080 [Verrucomicrobia bacterium RIFCSPHIGHO2_12_FULL_41_10]|nr:MAG: hypothetical protein A3F67_08080 [Verrucomicrobia bacterium RIFCSPHIGHO2_12_FULL_41_10]